MQSSDEDSEEIGTMRRHTRAVNHDGSPTALLLNGLHSIADGIRLVVGALGTTTEDDVDILVAAGLDDGGETLLGDAHEGVRVGSGVHGIDSDTNAAVGSVLEADGERDTGSELTVKLGLGSASANGTPGDHWDIVK